MSTPAHGVSPHKFEGCSRITDYEITGKLGEGTFGEVYRGKSKKTGHVVALKKILMHNERDGFPITALREIKLLKSLNHPNILHLLEMSIEHYQKKDDKRKRAVMYMISPFLDHDLSGLLANPSVNFTESHIKCYTMQLLEGLRYIHDHQILHRDIKAANLLINNRGILQIADFGLARHYSEHTPISGKGGGRGHRPYTGLVVTRWYRPPELLLGLREYTTAIDVWGVGCVFGEMLRKTPILNGESDPRQLEMIFELMGSPTEDNMPGWQAMPNAKGIKPRAIPLPSTLSTRFREWGSGAISLLNELLRLDYQKRINAGDALKHPYFRNSPLPSKPEEIPMFEESHELDGRRARDEQKARPPPPPKGGTVGTQEGGWNAAGNGASRYNSRDTYGSAHRGPPNGSRPPPASLGYRDERREERRDDRRNDRHESTGERRPAWANDRGTYPDTRLPPRPLPTDHQYNDRGRYAADPHRSDAYANRGRDRDEPIRGRDRDDQYRSRDRDRDDRDGRSRAGSSGDGSTYTSNHRPGDDYRRDDRPPRDDWRADDRRGPRWEDRDGPSSRDRQYDRPPPARLDYDDRGRNHTRSRSRSPIYGNGRRR